MLLQLNEKLGIYELLLYNDKFLQDRFKISLLDYFTDHLEYHRRSELPLKFKDYQKLVEEISTLEAEVGKNYSLIFGDKTLEFRIKLV